MNVRLVLGIACILVASVTLAVVVKPLPSGAGMFVLGMTAIGVLLFDRAGVMRGQR